MFAQDTSKSKPQQNVKNSKLFDDDDDEDEETKTSTAKTTSMQLTSMQLTSTESTNDDLKLINKFVSDNDKDVEFVPFDPLKVPPKMDKDVEFVLFDPLKVPQKMEQISIAEGWKTLGGNPPANFLQPTLCCELCNNFNGNNKMRAIMLPNKNFFNHLTVSEDWYPMEFIQGFVLIATHDAHMTPPIHPTGHKVMPVFTPFPKQAVSKILSYGDNTHFVSVVFGRGHFALLYYDIAGQSVKVYDGLNYDLETWLDHILHTIQTYGLASSSKMHLDQDKQENTDELGRLT